MKPILIVDDEKAIADLIRMTLTHAGYACECANDGMTAANMIEQNEYDLLLLDIMLPEVDGYDLLDCAAPTGVPVIFITAKASVADRVKGLRMGADDYIVKPFEPLELLARVESVLRRAGRGVSNLTLWQVEIDPVSRLINVDGTPVDLRPLEFDLLMVLVRNRGIALYRDILYERVWGDTVDDTRTLDLHIHRLRKKLGWEKHIRTISKVGYMLEAET